MTVPLSEAKSRLEDLIAQLRPGEELVLTDDANRPVARMVGEPSPAAVRLRREFPKFRHYSAAPDSAAPVCLAVGAWCWAACGLVGWEPLVGFACGLAVSILAVSALFAVAYGEDE